MTGGPQPDLLVRMATALLDHQGLDPALRHRCAALIARRATESLLDRVVGEVGVPPSATVRAKLLTARAVAPEVATTLEPTWAGLSELCHHRPYELGPDRSSTLRLIEALRPVTDAVRRHPTTASA